MFLERKFSAPGSTPAEYAPPLCPVLPRAEWLAFPSVVRDVLTNIQLLLKSRRHYDHVLPDYGLTPSEGRVGDEDQLERLQVELPQTLSRYEPRFTLGDVDFEILDDGTAVLYVGGTIRDCPGTFTFCFATTSRKILSLDYKPPKTESA